MTAREPLDLRAFACPLTWVKTRLALDRLAAGDVLEVWLPAGEAVESVPRSAEDDGHRVVSAEPMADGAVRVRLERGAGRAAEPLP